MVLLLKKTKYSGVISSILVLFIILGLSVIAGKIVATTGEANSLNSGEVTSFSVIGYISGIEDGSVSLTDANSSNIPASDSYVLSTDSLQKVETSEYLPINLSDLRVGDKVIIQGLANGGEIIAHRLIAFGVYEATTTSISASTTPLEIFATSTIEISEEATTTATSTSNSILDTFADLVADSLGVLIDKTGDYFGDSDSSTTTDTVMPENVATTTEPSETDDAGQSGEVQEANLELNQAELETNDLTEEIVSGEDSITEFETNSLNNSTTTDSESYSGANNTSQ